MSTMASPLRAKMARMPASSFSGGAYLISGMSKQEYGAAVYAARNNKCKLLYVSPERLQNEQFKAFA